MSDPVDHATRRSIRRSSLRDRATILLSSLGEAHPRFLAQALGVDQTRLKEIMHGNPPWYSVELAPITLGHAVLDMTAAGRVYRITSRGRKRARQLTSARVRDAAGRRAKREIARRELHDAAPPAVRTPVAVPPASCTYTWGIEVNAGLPPR